jgi:hypothetical protein
MSECQLLLVGLAALALLPGCGGSDTVSAEKLRSCIAKHVAPGQVARTFVHTEDGVTTLNYYTANGGEIDVNVFPSAKAAKDAEEQEARLGDAHDRRKANVLYSGGGAVERAVVTCLG